MSFVRLLRSHSFGVSVPVYRKCIFHSLTGNTRCRFGSHLPTLSSCAAVLACRPSVFNSLHPHRTHTHSNNNNRNSCRYRCSTCPTCRYSRFQFSQMQLSIFCFGYVPICVCVCMRQSTPAHRSIDCMAVWLR